MIGAWLARLFARPDVPPAVQAARDIIDHGDREREAAVAQQVARVGRSA